jgi:hypothetical protein
VGGGERPGSPGRSCFTVSFPRSLDPSIRPSVAPEPSLSPDPATVFIWDFDGTLADTRLRNYRITCRLFVDATGRGIEEFPALATFETFERTQRGYANWRQLLTREFGFTAAPQTAGEVGGAATRSRTPPLCP